MTHFVYLYVHGPRNGLELRHSMRSIHKNFCGDIKISVIGDRPQWYTGHHIPHTNRSLRVGGLSSFKPNQDTLRKMIQVCDSNEVDEEFVWMMDDVYFMNPITLEELREPRCDPWYSTKSNRVWHKLIRASFAALRARGYETHQYATHLPHVFEKSKMRTAFQMFDMPDYLFLFEVIYGNVHRSNPSSYRGFLRRFITMPNAQELQEAKAAKVLNYVGALFNRITVRSFIESEFDQSCPEELQC